MRMLIAMVVGLVVGRGAVAADSPEIESLQRQFMTFVADSDPAAARQLLEQHPEIMTSVTPSRGDSLLLRAARIGPIESLQLLVDAGASVQVVDNQGRTALHYAVEHRDDDSQRLRFFVERGVSIHVRDHRGATALHAASEAGKPDTVRWLVEQGLSADVRDGIGQSALHRWIQPVMRRPLNHQDPLVVPETLVSHGASIDARDALGRTPLMIAAVVALPVALEWYLDEGADPDAVDFRGRTALHHLATVANPLEAADRTRMVAGSSGEEWERATGRDGGVMILGMVMRRPIAEPGRILIEHTDNPDAKDHEGDTPLGLLVRCYESSPWIAQFKPADASVLEHLKQARLQLFHATGATAVARALREAGADPTAIGSDGRSVVEVARSLEEPIRAGILKALGEHAEE